VGWHFAVLSGVNLGYLSSKEFAVGRLAMKCRTQGPVLEAFRLGRWASSIDALSWAGCKQR
jgi:hypothetical protein